VNRKHVEQDALRATDDAGVVHIQDATRSHF